MMCKFELHCTECGLGHKMGYKTF